MGQDGLVPCRADWLTRILQQTDHGLYRLPLTQGQEKEQNQATGHVEVIGGGGVCYRFRSLVAEKRGYKRRGGAGRLPSCRAMSARCPLRSLLTRSGVPPAASIRRR
jgi:hypothetical protein